MKLSVFMIIKSLVTLFFGMAFLIIPAQALSIYGITTDHAGLLMSRFFGVGFMMIGLVCWFVGNAEASELRLDILLALFITDLLGFSLSLITQLTGFLNAAGWINVILWLLMALGAGYFRFLRQDALEQVPQAG
jgi:hypothetical protein